MPGDADRCFISAPALAATYLLVFARVGTMIMVLPGLGEIAVPTRIRLTVALMLAAVLFPLHRAAYQVDVRSLSSLVTMLVQEVMVGAVLGIAARLAVSALQLTGAVVAQQLGLGFVTSIDPTLGQQGVIIGNFLAMLGVVLIFATDTHYRVIAALNDSYTIFAPGEMPSTGDVAALAKPHRGGRVPDRCSAVGAVSGVRYPVQYRSRRAVAVDAADAGVLRRRSAVDLCSVS